MGTSKSDVWGQNFEEAMFVYILKQEIEYLLQGLWQLVASCLAFLSILIHFENYSEMALLFFTLLYKLSKNAKREQENRSNSYKEY